MVTHHRRGRRKDEHNACETEPEPEERRSAKLQNTDCRNSKVKVAPCLTLWDPTDYTVHGIHQARILEWVAVPFSRGIFPTQGLNPGLLHCRQILYQLSYQGST